MRAERGEEAGAARWVQQLPALVVHGLAVPAENGTVAVIVQRGRRQWIDTARRVEELGYSSLLMPDGLQRRRGTYGVSYVSVNGAFSEQFAPVVELLAGR